MNKKEFMKELKSELSFYDLSIKSHIMGNPGYYIGAYIKAMRLFQYYSSKNNTKFYWVSKLFWLYKMNKYATKTGFQFDGKSIGFGIKIYHWGHIIINKAARIGSHCTIYPGVTIGSIGKDRFPIIGDNCFIGLGAKVFGDVKVGDNVTICPNAVVVHNIPNNAIVGGVPAKILKYKE